MRRFSCSVLLLAACSPSPSPATRPMASIVARSIVFRSGESAGSHDPMPVHVPATIPYMPVIVPDSSVEHSMLVAPSGPSFGVPFHLGPRPGAQSSPTNPRVFIYGDTLKIPQKKK
jgi:hypothetical protein